MPIKIFSFIVNSILKWFYSFYIKKPICFFKSRLGHRNLKTFGDITSITVIKHKESDVRHLARGGF